MFDINITLGPINVGITTDERVSVDLMDMLISKAVVQTMILDESHLGNMVKYDNYDNDNNVDCDECSSLNEEQD
jgi:hypothetical protein